LQTSCLQKKCDKYQFFVIYTTNEDYFYLIFKIKSINLHHQFIRYENIDIRLDRGIVVIETSFQGLIPDHGAMKS